jgi:hypothetical protein
MPQYWIKTAYKTHGPFNAPQLKKLAEKGELKPYHLVSTDQQRWGRAEKVKGLEFPQETPASSSQATSGGPPPCHKCNEPLRRLQMLGEPTKKMLCAVCDITPGICPQCGGKLRTDRAQQCLHCKASWRAASKRKETKEHVQPQQASSTLEETGRDGLSADSTDAEVEAWLTKNLIAMSPKQSGGKSLVKTAWNVCVPVLAGLTMLGIAVPYLAEMLNVKDAGGIGVLTVLCGVVVVGIIGQVIEYGLGRTVAMALVAYWIYRLYHF